MCISQHQILQKRIQNLKELRNISKENLPAMLATTAFDLQNNNLKSPGLTQSFSTNDITTEPARLRNKIVHGQ